MGTLKVNKEFIHEFISGPAPCMTIGLATFDNREVIFIGLRPECELNVSGTDVGTAIIPIPQKLAVQFHFITDQNAYYYCLLNPAFRQIQNLLSKIETLDILFMIIQPNHTGSSGLLPLGSEIHEMLTENLFAISACGPENDISEVEHLAGNFLGMMGKPLAVRCLDDSVNYDYFANPFIVNG
jgi:hypothetical protein